jgi:DNA-binding NarL/FixJ family response regulator
MSDDDKIPRFPSGERHDHYHQGVCKATKVFLALIDPRPLNRVSLSYLLETSSAASRRSDDFLILAFPEPAGLLADDSESCQRVRLILLSIGAACVNDERVLESIRLLMEKLPHLPLVILSDCDKGCHIREAFRHGISGYIPTMLSPSVVVQALRLIMAGGTFIPPNIFLPDAEGGSIEEKSSNVIRLTNKEGLTPRQVEVLRLLRQGKSNKSIAYELQMQESTVKVHIREIMRRLKVTNRTHAALLASQVL